MQLYFITLFPEECEHYFLKGIFKRAVDNSVFQAHFIDLRRFGTGRLKKVDDYPFSKKLGMLLRADVVRDAIQSIDGYAHYRLIYPCPKGVTFNMNVASQYSHCAGMVFLPGYYEGIDERIFSMFDVERISLGNFVLSASDSAALVMAEAVVRQLDGVVGKQESVLTDSFFTNLLEYPQYTQPREIDRLPVPDVLLSGHHGHIDGWQKKMAIAETLFQAPNLLAKNKGMAASVRIVTEIIQEAVL